MRIVSFSKAIVATLALSCVVAGTASAQMPYPSLPSGSIAMGLELTAVDPAARKIEGVQHCVEPARAGQRASFALAPQIDMSYMTPGTWISVIVDTNTEPDMVVDAFHVNCLEGGPPPPPGGDYPMPPPGGPGGHDMPVFQQGFLSRVWKFDAETDSYEPGKLSITVAKILNLPKKFRAQDDELVDEDALVLFGKSVRVYDDGKRVAQGKLDDSEHVRVQGKLLPPDKWQKDEDEMPVTTIRAKKLFIVD